LSVVLREQLSRQVDNATLVRYDTAMAQYLRGETPTDVPPMLAMLFVPVNQNFMKSLAGFDPVAAIKSVRQPVLIVQGGRDLQVGWWMRSGWAVRGQMRRSSSSQPPTMC